MRRTSASGLVLLWFGLLAGVTGCSSGTATGPAAQKSAFCSANTSLDKAGQNANSPAQILALLKAHKADLTTMSQNLPGGTLRSEAASLVNAETAAVASDNANQLNYPASTHPDLDTYCGEDGNGKPLPAYFAQGKSGSFCSTFIAIQSAISNTRPDPADILQVLIERKAEVATLASEVAGLPSTIRTQATSLIEDDLAAIASNSTSPIQNSSGDQVSLYCGINF